MISITSLVQRGFDTLEAAMIHSECEHRCDCPEPTFSCLRCRVAENAGTDLRELKGNIDLDRFGRLSLVREALEEVELLCNRWSEQCLFCTVVSREIDEFMDMVFVWKRHWQEHNGYCDRATVRRTLDKLEGHGFVTHVGACRPGRCVEDALAGYPPNVPLVQYDDRWGEAFDYDTGRLHGDLVLAVSGTADHRNTVVAAFRCAGFHAEPLGARDLLISSPSEVACHV